MPRIEDTLFYRMLEQRRALEEQKAKRYQMGMDLANAHARQVDFDQQQQQREQQFAQQLGAAATEAGQPIGQVDYTGQRAGGYEALGALQARGKINAANRETAASQAKHDDYLELQRMLEGSRRQREESRGDMSMERLGKQLQMQQRVAEIRARAQMAAVQAKKDPKGMSDSELNSGLRQAASELAGIRKAIADGDMDLETEKEMRSAEDNAMLRQRMLQGEFERRRGQPMQPAAPTPPAMAPPQMQTLPQLAPPPGASAPRSREEAASRILQRLQEEEAE